jgi:RimJ/RimL family protein N-acetyltransferase
MLVEFGFNELKLNRIEIMVDLRNLASQRVAEKLSTVREGILRKRFVVHGKSNDMLIFSLIPEDLA